jgi:hypothetical protein
MNDWDIRFDKLEEQLHTMDKTLVKQEENLKIHLYRTELAERNIDLLSKALEPINKHVSHMEGALKFIGILSLVVGVVSILGKFFL